MQSNPKSRTWKIHNSEVKMCIPYERMTKINFEQLDPETHLTILKFSRDKLKFMGYTTLVLSRSVGFTPFPAFMQM